MNLRIRPLGDSGSSLRLCKANRERFFLLLFFNKEGVNGYFLLGTRITLQVLHLGLNKIALFSFERECRCQRSSSHKCVRK